MKIVEVTPSVAESTNQIKKMLQEKGFTIFCEIDHKKNASDAGLKMPESRVLIFGNPEAGTKLMLADITMSLDLPMRIAITENDAGSTQVIYQTSEDYSKNYQVKDHPVLGKIDALFGALVSAL